MRKLILILISVFVILGVAGLQGKAEAEEILGCYKKNNGQLRIVSDHSECLKSENPIVLGQLSSSSTAKLACVTAQMKNPTEASAEIMITNQKNISVNDAVIIIEI